VLASGIGATLQQTLADYYERAMERTALTLLLLGVTAGMALLLVWSESMA
jgi:hypothetical protein